MKRWPVNVRLLLWLALTLSWLGAGGGLGCTTNQENISERPWNTPKSWETGLPSGMIEERR